MPVEIEMKWEVIAMVTKFGKFCKELRLDNAEILYDMAQRLNVSSAFLSKVENGKAKPPIKWKKDIAYEYNLTTDMINKLSEYIDEARGTEVVNLSDLSIDDRDMMLKFARKLNDMDEEKKQMFRELLK